MMSLFSVFMPLMSASISVSGRRWKISIWTSRRYEHAPPDEVFSFLGTTTDKFSSSIKVTNHLSSRVLCLFLCIELCLSYLVLSCLAMSYHALACLVVSSLVFCCLLLPRLAFALSCLALPRLVLWDEAPLSSLCLLLSCRVLSLSLPCFIFLDKQSPRKSGVESLRRWSHALKGLSSRVVSLRCLALILSYVLHWT